MGAAPLLLKWLEVYLSNTISSIQGRGIEGERKKKYFWKNLLTIFFKCHNFFSFANGHTVFLGSTPCHLKNTVWLDSIFTNFWGISGCAITGLERYRACGLPWRAGQSSPHRSCVCHRQRHCTGAEVGNVSLPLASEGEILAFKRVYILCWSFKPSRGGHNTK